MNKKYGIAAIIACTVIAGVLIFAYNNAGTENSAGKSQQLNGSNSIPVNPPVSTTGRHFFAGVNETLTLKANP